MSGSRKKSFQFKKSVRRNPIVIEYDQLVDITNFSSKSVLPALISPAVPDLDLAHWIENNKALLEKTLQKQAAILFRGFQINDIESFEKVAAKICRRLYNENGEHPRTKKSNNVYQPVFYSPDKQLLWHNENSFNYQFPTKIMFGCLIPAEIGGETPLVDSREVYQQIDPYISKLFETKQVMYVRNYSKQLGLDWETVFNTSDRKKVEQECHKSKFSFEWKADDTLRTKCVRPAVVTHPITNEKVWFNQAQHWHISCLDSKTRNAISKSFDEKDFPRHCYFGDGTPIEDSVMSEILAVYENLEIIFQWQSGDFILIDNLLAAHGRNPFEGERKLLVSLGDMMNFDELN